MKPNPFPALNHLTVPVSFIYFTSPWQQLEAGISMRMGPDLGNPQALSAHMKTCVMLKTSLILAFRRVVAGRGVGVGVCDRSEEHTSELQSLRHLVCRL